MWCVWYACVQGRETFKGLYPKYCEYRVRVTLGSLKYFLFPEVQNLFSKVRHLAISLKGPPVKKQYVGWGQRRAEQVTDTFFSPPLAAFVFLSSEPLARKMKLKVLCVCFSTTSFSGTTTLLREIKLTSWEDYYLFLALCRPQQSADMSTSREGSREEAVEMGGSHDGAYRRDHGKELLKLY